MNSVSLIGRIVRDPEVRYSQSGSAFATFAVAIDRGKDQGADFPQILCLGKLADFAEKYLAKGKRIAVQGKLQTSSYEREGRKIYKTEVLADRIEFLDRKEDAEPKEEKHEPIPEGFAQLDDDIPF